MAPASCLPISHTVRARRGGLRPALVLLPILAAVLAPCIARADIYKWTDEQGGTVVSDVLPTDPSKVSGLKRLATARPVPPAPAPYAPTAAESRQQELETRVEELERELAARQMQDVPQTNDGGYYPAPPPPPDAGYYGSEQFVDSPVYYPAYYSPPIVYTVVTVPVRHIVRRPISPPRPAFVPGRVGVRRHVTASGPVFVSRPPQFTGRPPQFTGRPPQFVGPAPQFVGPAPQFTGPTPQFVSRPAVFASRPSASIGFAQAARPAHSTGQTRYGGRR